jgi:L,D-transpeptidase-like protein
MSAVNVGLVRATILVVLAFCILPVGAAHARLLFWPQWGSWWGDHVPLQHSAQRPRHKHAKPKLDKKDQAQNAPNGPLQIIVSIADQRISVYDNGALIARSSVSTGIRGHPTPLGVFSVISKQRWHRSNLYSDAPMPYMQRITWSGIALHDGVVPGHPASHGCIRLKHDFAVRLWHLTKRGTRVIIAQNEVKPVEVASPHLFAPKPKLAQEIPVATVPADSGTVRTAAVTADPERKDDSSAQPGASPKAAPRKPVSVLVSRKTGKLYVRQGFTPLFDATIAIRNPELPLGTHVFTAMFFTPGDSGIRWNAVSLDDALTGNAADRKKGDPLPRAEPIPANVRVSTLERAFAALNRITIPQTVIDQISELISPGSSLIISDQGISTETGPDTDFIVLTPR